MDIEYVSLIMINLYVKLRVTELHNFLKLKEINLKK